ncbi:major tail protein [Fictibacillus fluitans]|uniref:Phage tail protein n=1 Tax=Fictibacillus fluitans TaxID=3058422 RepID=A0ABT8HX17_9BACL|nr:major tail protein [Fictibacillus sp. NE201]MDN4525322.1 phage tail protein [Fictibacillus sp. NE201]
MAENKNYRATVGVSEFYYATLDETEVNADSEIERVKFLQNITVEMPQEIVRAYGDNVTAEMGVSSGNTNVSGAFHKLPSEDKRVLFGLESTADGLDAYGGEDDPPYVACVFAKTRNDGSKEWVGLPKGKFMRSNIAGQTKEDGLEFQNDEISAEFMDREVTGFANPKSVVTGSDNKGETVKRDALFQAIFGKPYPGAPEGV